MGYEIVHASAKYAALFVVILFLIQMDVGYLTVYIVLFLIFGYWLHKRDRKKKN